MQNFLARNRKFGKSIQKKQLEIPEYAASFVNYKALKKVRSTPEPYHAPSHRPSQLIKELQNSPVTRPGFLIDDVAPQHPQSTLQANKGSFFFRLVSVSRLLQPDHYG